MAEKRHREDGLEERREDLALALPDISGCSVSASSHLEMALVVAGTPEGPEIKRRRSKKNVNRVQPTLGLKILLPNKTSVRLSIVREPPLSLRQLLRRLSEQAKGGKYSVDCDEDLLLKDPVNGSAPEIRTDEDLASLFRCPEAERTLLLVVGIQSVPAAEPFCHQEVHPNPDAEFSAFLTGWKSQSRIWRQGDVEHHS